MESFFEFWAVVFVEDMSEFMFYEIVYNLRLGHDYFPVVGDVVFGRACSPARAICSDADFSWFDFSAGESCEFLCELVGAFC